jgi:hypothetical protein
MHSAQVLSVLFASVVLRHEMVAKIAVIYYSTYGGFSSSLA